MLFAKRHALISDLDPLLFGLAIDDGPIATVSMQASGCLVLQSAIFAIEHSLPISSASLTKQLR
jgi:hypothetical protein